MPKLFVLDTSVLIHDPDALFNFQENIVGIPLEVIKELDRIKTENTERGQAARSVERKMLAHLDRNEGREGKLPNGGTLRILMPPSSILSGKTKELLGEMDTPDHRIIAAAVWAREADTEKVSLVSKDMGMILKARAVSLPTEDYKFDKNAEAEGETETIQLEDKELARFAAEGEIELEASRVGTLEINTYGLFVANKKMPWRHKGQGRFVAVSQGVVKVPNGMEIHARNLEQVFLLDALLNPEIHLVTVTGKAGTGKTLVTVAAALQLIGARLYTGMCISKPNESIGKENGFLPGPQPLTAKVLTPTGWTTMGKIQVGDVVIAWDGKPAKVLSIHPQGQKQVFRITTHEEKTTEACGTHPWLVRSYEEFKRNKPGAIRTTEEIRKSLTTAKGKPNARLPRNKTVEFSAQRIEFPAYTLGALLGDGNWGQAVSLSCNDPEIVARVEKEIRPLGCKLTKVGINHFFARINAGGNKQKRGIRLTNLKTKEVQCYSGRSELAEKTGMNATTLASRCERNRTVAGIYYEYLPQETHSENPCKDWISKAGLLGKKAPEKFVPDEYKYNSVGVRLALLQGLLDTDGHIKPAGSCAFSTTSPQLAADVLEIVRSLGGKGQVKPVTPKKKPGKINGREIQARHKSYTVNLRLPGLVPFHLGRKAKRHRTNSTKREHCDYVASITPAGEKKTQCLLIDHPSHLYITDDYIVTHNTIEEKMRPWLQPYADALNFLHRKSPPQNRKQSQRKKEGDEKDHPTQRPYDRLTESGLVEITALEYIRGRSIPNRIFVADETQNVAPKVIKTITSRMAEGSKLIYLGDLEQIDNPYLDRYSNGLAHVRAKMRNLANAAHLTLKKGERSLLAEQAAKLL